MNKILILIPTYNEAENINALYSEIKKLKLKADILFVDDNSPDKTAEIIKKISSKDNSVKLILRQGKEGVGGAHLAGIQYAYEKKYDTLVTMDADFTHKPKDITKFLKQKNKADIVVGSRYISSNSLSEWNYFRKTVTNTAHMLTKLLLKMPFDATGAFRMYNLKKIPKEVFKLVESKDYSFFFESLFILYLNKFKIKEISVTLPARTYGTTKMTISDAVNGLKFLFQTFYLSKIYQDSYTYCPVLLHPNKKPEKAEREWDEYWLSERKQRKILYDATAVFYRKYIIRRTLNYYMKKHFKKGAKMLHAGCGGGQVDTDVVRMVNVTALDISTGALNRYKNLYKDSCKVLQGSILNLPIKDGSFDGVYNLGVMEHFSPADIKKILDEFHRVLKKNGKIMLFWPPVYGSSVYFLDSLHFVLNNILHKNIRLHPEEYVRVKSKKQISTILGESGFKLIGFYFGPRDFFTYQIIVAEKI